jgi:ribosomal protein L9
VVLKQDITNLGTRGTITTVPNGFFRNYLKPQNLADIATQGILQ